MQSKLGKDYVVVVYLHIIDRKINGQRFLFKGIYCKSLHKHIIWQNEQLFPFYLLRKPTFLIDFPQNKSCFTKQDYTIKSGYCTTCVPVTMKLWFGKLTNWNLLRVWVIGFFTIKLHFIAAKVKCTLLYDDNVSI